MPRRFDSGTLAEPVKLSNGFLRCDARITKVGVFNYRLADNSVRRELRLPEDVFHSDSLSSFHLMPFTNAHPGEAVTAKNAGKFKVGTVSNPERHDSYVVANIQIEDESTIDDAQKGKREISCGYNCDLEMRAGVTDGIEGVPDGMRFDAIQRNIRGNHVALVAKGRAGSDVSLRLDADDGQQVSGEMNNQQNLPFEPKDQAMTKLTIDGVDFEVTPQVHQAVSKMTSDAETAKAEKAKLQADVESEKKRADEAEKKTAELQAKYDADTSAESVGKLIKARVALQQSASKILGEKNDKGEKIKLDEMSDDDIRKAVILKSDPEAKLDDAEPAYLSARFDHAVATWKPAKPKNDGLNRVASAGSGGGDRNDAASAQARMIERHRNAWKQPTEKQPAQQG
jgi:hypothetical protein